MNFITLRAGILSICIAAGLASAASGATTTEGASAATDAIVCTGGTKANEALEDLRKNPPLTAASTSQFNFLPKEAKIAVKFPITDAQKKDYEKLSFRAIVTTAPPREKAEADDVFLLVGDGEIWSGMEAAPKNEQNANIVVSFIPPAAISSLHTSYVYLIGCLGGQVKLAATFQSWASDRWTSFFIAIITTVLAYFAVAYAVCRRNEVEVLAAKEAAVANPDSPNPRTGTKYLYEKSRWYYLNPIVLSAGQDGKASPQKLQILFFSLIIFYLLFYILLRVGELSGLSLTVLSLMGISGLAVTAAAGADAAKNTLTFENWAWLVRKGWIPQGGASERNQASWHDVFTTNGEFDVYRFQMIIFSFVVGMALLYTELTELATFDIPKELLGLLGISQLVYFIGKVVAPPTFHDLNEKIKETRTKEDTVRRAVAAQIPAPMGPGNTRPTIIENTVEYKAYELSAEELALMVQKALGFEVGQQKQKPAL